MTWAPTTRLHVSGHRFLLRRLECAVLGRDITLPGTVNEPLYIRALSLLAGSMLAALAVAGCVIVGTLRPQAALGDGPIVLAQESGALYVRVGEIWHPVLNLASARLIAGASINPHLVRESELNRTKRGPLLGIPGAPQNFGEPLAAEETVWTLCDSDGSAPLTTTAIVGAAVEPHVRPPAAEQTVLVTADANTPVYLLYSGRRAAVDLADPVVARVLRLDGRTPRRVSRMLLNAVPEVPPITAPQLVGTDRSSPVPGFPVGSVLRVARTDGDEYYVVLPAGVQRIGQVAADLVRLSDSRGARGIVAVAPDIIRSSPTVNTLPVSTFPDRVSASSRDDHATLCVSWAPRRDGAGISISLSQGLPVPIDRAPVLLAQADNDGPALDAVFLPPGRSAYVRSTGLAGDHPRAGTRYLVTDAGVRFAIHDDDAARDLGLPTTAAAAPWQMLATLPPGPELSRQSASVARDSIPAGSR